MKKAFVSYAKLSKKEKRKIDARRRRTWGPLDPVTRRSDNPRAYRRAKVKQADARGAETGE